MKFNVRNIFQRALSNRGKASDESKPVKVPPTFNGNLDLDKKLVLSLAKQRFPTWKQLQYLPEYLTQREKLIVRLLIGATIICLGFLLVRFCQRHVEYLPQQGGSYTEAIVGQPSYVNPVLAQGDVDRDITVLIYSGLFRYDEQLQLVPDLAASYELSEDKKTYTIHLRKGVKWHNGNELLADDILYTIETVQDPDYNSPFYSNFNGVATERIDDHTVTFTLNEPFAPFLSNLTIGILPGHIWSDVAPANFKLAEYNTKPIGSGPYAFKELVKDHSGIIKSYTLERNERYYGQLPYIDTIIMKLYPDFASATEALKSGTVDGMSYVPKEYRETLAEKKGITLYPLQLPQYTAVFFNQKNELLKDQELKKALANAVDRSRILEEALQGQGKVISAPILEGFLGFSSEIGGYAYNPAQAAAELDELEWTIPEGGGLRTKDGAELKFSLTTVDQPEYLKTADILRENWEAIGVGIELKIMNPLRVDKEVIKPRDYEAFLYGEILGSDPDPYPFWHSSQSLDGGLNLSNYYNKDVDKLLEEARKIENADERASKYIDFQKIIADEVPALFLYSPTYDHAIAREIKGVATTRITIPSDRFNGITSWYIKTRLGWD
ncbi:MAG: ABC transporter substrate-binding protein [Patescibacteria group bacterium]